MKKIRRFAVGENAILLSAEQMRQIGGGSVQCITDACEVWIDGEKKYDGTCAIDMEGDYCYCKTEYGNFAPSRPYNGCEA